MAIGLVGHRAAEVMVVVVTATRAFFSTWTPSCCGR
jgi:hypothetical protein